MKYTKGKQVCGWILFSRQALEGPSKMLQCHYLVTVSGYFVSWIYIAVTIVILLIQVFSIKIYHHFYLLLTIASTFINLLVM